MSNQQGGQQGQGGGLLGAIPPTAWFYIIGIPMVLGASYFLLFRPVLKKLNIIKTKEDELAEKIWKEVKLQPFWTANYYKSYGGDTISSQEASDYAQTLNTAMKGGLGWGTNEDSIVGVFSALGSKGNISKVVEAYNISNQADLLAHLEDELAIEDLNEIATKISIYAS